MSDRAESGERAYQDACPKCGSEQATFLSNIAESEKVLVKCDGCGLQYGTKEVEPDAF